MSSPSKQVRWAFDITQLEEVEEENVQEGPASRSSTPLTNDENKSSPESPPEKMRRTHRTTGSASSMSSFTSDTSFSSFWSSSSHSSDSSGSPSSYTQSFFPIQPRTPAAPFLSTVPLPEQESTTHTPRPGSPQEILLDKALQSNNPSLLHIDLSYPTWRYQESLDMRAKYTTLQRSACDPPVRSLEIIIQTDSYEAEFVIGTNTRDANEGRPFVTVGAVLGGIRQQLRKRLDMTTSVTQELHTFFERRVATVNGRATLSREAYETNRQREKDEGYRVVDKLLGQTCFAGLTIKGTSPRNEGCALSVRLELRTPERYQQLQ